MQQDSYATNNSVRFNRNLGLGSPNNVTVNTNPGGVISANFTNSNFFNSATGTFFVSDGSPVNSPAPTPSTDILLNVSFQYASTTTTLMYATIVRSTTPLFTSNVTNLSTSDGTSVSNQNNALWSAAMSGGSPVTCNMVFYDTPPFGQTCYYGIQVNTNGSGTFHTANIIVASA